MNKNQLEIFSKLFNIPLEKVEKDLEDLVNNGIMQKDVDGNYCLTFTGETITRILLWIGNN